MTVPDGFSAALGQENDQENRPKSAEARGGHPGPGFRQIYLGAGTAGPVLAPAEHSVLVLGPPRSGKTSSLVVPNVLAFPGPVVSSSTKPEVLKATVPSRSQRGECLLFDPTGSVDPPPGVRRIRWSPVPACAEWDGALLMARALVETTKPAAEPAGATESNHWQERAGALLAPLLHAAATAGEPLPTVLAWVDRRQPATALRILDEAQAVVAADLLAGITTGDGREQSGIWSTASGVLSGYRGDAARASTVDPDFEARAFCRTASTLYICAPGQQQALVAPMVVGLLREVRAAAYAEHAWVQRRGAPSPTPTLLALDEVANVAPIPDLPSMVSEGGGQGLLTLACLQDLSQGRVRWGTAADGFLSLFGTTVVLPGIGDVQTLRAISALAGDIEVPVRSVNTPLPDRGAGAVGRLVKAMVQGRRAPTAWAGGSTITWSTRPEPRLPVDALGRGRSGMALALGEGNSVEWIGLTPWFTHEPWQTLVRGRSHEREPALGRSRGGLAAPGPRRFSEPDLGR